MFTFRFTAATFCVPVPCPLAAAATVSRGRRLASAAARGGPNAAKNRRAVKRKCVPVAALLKRGERWLLLLFWFKRMTLCDYITSRIYKTHLRKEMIRVLFVIVQILSGAQICKKKKYMAGF
jgi:hypothetical protein